MGSGNSKSKPIKKSNTIAPLTQDQKDDNQSEINNEEFMDEIEDAANLAFGINFSTIT